MILILSGRPCGGIAILVNKHITCTIEYVECVGLQAFLMYKTMVRYAITHFPTVSIASCQILNYVYICVYAYICIYKSSLRIMHLAKLPALFRT